MRGAGFYIDQSLVPHQSKNLERKQKIAEGIKLSLHTTGWMQFIHYDGIDTICIFYIFVRKTPPERLIFIVERYAPGEGDWEWLWVWFFCLSFLTSCYYGGTNLRPSFHSMRLRSPKVHLAYVWDVCVSVYIRLIFNSFHARFFIHNLVLFSFSSAVFLLSLALRAALLLMRM